MSTAPKDVNLEPNWATIHEYFERANVELFEELLEKLPAEIARRCKDMSRVRRRNTWYRKYPDTWEPLGTWLEIEKAEIAVLGHGYHLREVGQFSRFATFGLDALKAGLVANAVGRFFTSPLDGLNNVGFVAERCIRNKVMSFIQTESDAGYIVMKHHRAIADPLDDFWSVSSFIPGFGDGVNLFWHQAMDTRSRSTVVAMSVLRVLARHAPQLNAEIKKGKLLIDDEVYGELVYILPHESGFVLDVSDTVSEPIAYAIPVIRMTKDVYTPCTRCADHQHARSHPLLWKDQIFQCSEQPEHCLPNSAFSVFWQKKWVDGLRGLGSRLVMRKAIAHAQTEAELTVVRHELMSMSEYLERMTPTRKLAHQLAQGELDPFSREMVVLQVDLVGFTEMVKRDQLSATEQRRLLGTVVMNEFRIARTFGGWSYKSIGDCAVIVFCPSWPKYDNEILPCASMRDAAKQAIWSAHKMHSAAYEKNLSVRIGIHADMASWSDISKEGMNEVWMGETVDEREFFEGSGDAFNKAARLEKVAQPGSTAVSEYVLRLIHGDKQVDDARGGIDGVMSNVKLSGGFVYQGCIEVKGGGIDAWVRRENLDERLPDSVAGIDVSTIEVLPDAQRKWDESHMGLDLSLLDGDDDEQK